MANPYSDAGGAVNVIAGSFDKLFWEERNADGTALSVPHTPAVKAILFFGKAQLDVKDDAAATTTPVVKTPALGRNFTVSYAADVSSDAASAPLTGSVTITVVESAGTHLRLVKQLKGKSGVISFGLGQRGDAASDLVVFGKWDVSTSIPFEPEKETTFSMKFNIGNNAAEIEPTVPTDDTISATDYTIPANEGFMIIDTE